MLEGFGGNGCSGSIGWGLPPELPRNFFVPVEGFMAEYIFPLLFHHRFKHGNELTLDKLKKCQVIYCWSTLMMFDSTLSMIYSLSAPRSAHLGIFKFFTDHIQVQLIPFFKCCLALLPKSFSSFLLT